MRITNRLRAIRTAEKRHIDDMRYGDGYSIGARVTRRLVIGRGPYAAWLPRRTR